MQVVLQCTEINPKISKSKISKDEPISVYAVSKLTMEYLSRVYFKNFKLKSVGLRFFTV